MDSNAETVRHLKNSLKIARFLGTSPYVWSAEEKLEFSGHRSFRYVFFVVQLALYLTYESFVAFRWIQISFFGSNVTSKEKMGIQYVAFSYSIPVLLHLCSFFNADQLHHFINRLMLYQQGSWNGQFALNLL